METLIAFLKAFPRFIALIDRLSAAWVAMRIGQMDRAIENGVRNAFEQQDQRDLEHAIGSPVAGKPSGNPGTVIRPELPGVRK